MWLSQYCSLRNQSRSTLPETSQKRCGFWWDLKEEVESILHKFGGRQCQWQERSIILAAEFWREIKTFRYESRKPEKRMLQQSRWETIRAWASDVIMAIEWKDLSNQDWALVTYQTAITWKWKTIQQSGSWMLYIHQSHCILAPLGVNQSKHSANELAQYFSMPCFFVYLFILHLSHLTFSNHQV